MIYGNYFRLLSAPMVNCIWLYDGYYPPEYVQDLFGIRGFWAKLKVQGSRLRDFGVRLSNLGVRVFRLRINATGFNKSVFITCATPGRMLVDLELSSHVHDRFSFFHVRAKQATPYIHP